MKDYKKSIFTAKLHSGTDIEHNVYTKGAGPVVLIVQELPGIGPETLRLADNFVSQGFTVVLPHLFGPIGKVNTFGNTLRVMCMRKEFRIFEQGKTSPIVAWLRALCHDLKAQHQVPGVAVIGMCLTGNFAISLMADDAVLAGVASQPSLPVNHHADLHMSQQDIQQIRSRLDNQEPMLAFRFAEDTFCQGARFEKLDQAFNDDRQRIKLQVLPGKGHAVLTRDFVDELGHPTKQALEQVVAYFRRALTP
ncbi:dienelactone hydrolase family protein [uncultured Paraglaciecola sp.]|uniref:dienelactone hydrolase family protein n=1 Tax=uncultured Paraglaciecola sp. TaxID=1765024 RepID=UPI00262F9D89|nr:dienelactone hydrolase family protein [uncultured Paraglaciecola sp.]